MKNLLFARLIMAGLLAAAAWSDTLSVSDTFSVAIPRGLAPLYEKPAPGGLPISYLESTDTCRIDSSRHDSTGVAWLMVRSGTKSGWLQKSSVRPPRLKEDTVKSEARARKADPDAKRRYRLLEGHQDWPRRIIKAVREGRVCLDMTDEQLLVSWGGPAQKSKAFILGVGSQDLWIFNGSDGKSQVVFLVKGRVVGWSEK